MAEETSTETTTETEAPTWDALKQSWETSGLSPAQIQGRLEASRKWEQRAKAAPSGEELETLRARAARAEALENDLATDTERIAKEARTATEKELRATLGAQSVEDSFRLVIGDRKTDDEITDFLADLNLNRFLGENGRVDTAKVLTRANQYAPATGTTTTTAQQATTRPGPLVTGVGAMTCHAGTPGDQGRAAAEARFGKKTQ